MRVKKQLFQTKTLTNRNWMSILKQPVSKFQYRQSRPTFPQASQNTHILSASNGINHPTALTKIELQTSSVWLVNSAHIARFKMKPAASTVNYTEGGKGTDERLSRATALNVLKGAQRGGYLTFRIKQRNAEISNHNISWYHLLIKTNWVFSVVYLSIRQLLPTYFLQKGTHSIS